MCHFDYWLGLFFLFHSSVVGRETINCNKFNKNIQVKTNKRKQEIIQTRKEQHHKSEKFNEWLAEKRKKTERKNKELPTEKYLRTGKKTTRKTKTEFEHEQNHFRQSFCSCSFPLIYKHFTRYFRSRWTPLRFRTFYVFVFFFAFYFVSREN